MKKHTPETVSRERQLLALLCRALDDKKAGDLRVIEVAGLSSITDYLVIATGLAEPHLRAMRIAAEQVLDANGVKIAGMDTNQQSGWLVVDAYQIMLHFFTASAREKYALEQLWRDGREIPLAEVLNLEAAPAKAKAAAKATVPRKRAAPAARPRTKTRAKAKKG